MHQLNSIATVIVLFIVVIIVAEIFKPRRCSVCNSPFKRKYYKWKIAGKNQYLCPACSARMDRKVSKQKFEQKFGKWLLSGNLLPGCYVQSSVESESPGESNLTKCGVAHFFFLNRADNTGDSIKNAAPEKQQQLIRPCSARHSGWSAFFILGRCVLATKRYGSPTTCYVK